ncbi:uncharacterized protein N7529_004104 [Penicillium soppii]|uniref:uncharacterized protein n=1 Tax=Penicillium soppii TaxID=69789 RepID=UPI002549BB77|nr:uncharacterized protein N7529_004104 [Penicillium soppii]KAJ5871751.1 hypothetical protein N7529_004104 [Penicillium soppii]
MRLPLQSVGSIQVVSDILMFILPQKIIWGLQMNLQKKLGVSIIFGVGILASVAACFRLSHTIKFANEPDSMYLISPILFWACGEMTCGFFIFSIPCLSRMIKESGLPQRVKSVLNFSGTRSSNSTYENSNSLAPVSRSWKKNNAEATWSNLDDDDIPLGAPGASESKENLRCTRSRDRKNTIQVVHTTNVTVSKERPSGDGVSSPVTP